VRAPLEEVNGTWHEQSGIGVRVCVSISGTADMVLRALLSAYERNSWNIIGEDIPCVLDWAGGEN
jgi:hypothetical protein